MDLLARRGAILCWDDLALALVEEALENSHSEEKCEFDQWHKHVEKHDIVNYLANIENPILVEIIVDAIQ